MMQIWLIKEAIMRNWSKMDLYISAKQIRHFKIAIMRIQRLQLCGSRDCNYVDPDILHIDADLAQQIRDNV